MISADRAADVGEVPQFGGPVPRKTHHRDRPGAQQPEQRDRELGRVRKLQQHPVALGDAEIGQPAGHPVGNRVELGE